MREWRKLKVLGSRGKKVWVCLVVLGLGLGRSSWVGAPGLGHGHAHGRELSLSGVPTALRPGKASRAEGTTKGSRESHWEGSMADKRGRGAAPTSISRHPGAFSYFSIPICKMELMAFDLPASRGCWVGRIRHCGNLPRPRECCTRHGVPWWRQVPCEPKCYKWQLSDQEVWPQAHGPGRPDSKISSFSTQGNPSTPGSWRTVKTWLTLMR